ncbi:MAG TPA: DinB family protein [Candidatus Eisenbacteria bacterium]|nr:DinB family protein [Candidatus Eisenbacteria bacterium]
MPTVEREVLVMPTGFASREAASFIAQLDDQSARLRDDTRGLTPEALAWQPAPGMNTIGMLLAHNAIVEAFWTQVGPLGLQKPYEVMSVLGIGMDDDGMPIPEDGEPPATLRGKDLAFYDDLLARARVYAREAASKLTDADLEREIVRTRRDGVIHETTMRWVLYHMVEHFAGHYGQINLLTHQYRLVGTRV